MGILLKIAKIRHVKIATRLKVLVKQSIALTSIKLTFKLNSVQSVNYNF